MKARSSKAETPSDEDAATLTISPEKVCFIIVRAREFDAKDQVTEPDPGSNPSDDKDAAVLEDHSDDPVVEELTSFFVGRRADRSRCVDVVGRDDYSASDWPTVRAEAARALRQLSSRHATDCKRGL